MDVKFASLESLIVICRCPIDDTPDWYFYGLVSLSVIAFTLAAALYTLFWMDIHLTILGIGGTLNIAACMIIKEVCGVQRHNPMCGYRYGFPSGHAQSAAFFAAYFIYQFYRVLVIHGDTMPLWAKGQLYARIAMAACYVLLVGYSRVYLGTNTAEDVFAGMVMGCVVAVVFIYTLDYLMEMLFTSKKSISEQYKID